MLTIWFQRFSKKVHLLDAWCDSTEIICAYTMGLNYKLYDHLLEFCSKTKWSRFIFCRFVLMLCERAIFIWKQMLNLLKIQQCTSSQCLMVFVFGFLAWIHFLGLFTALFGRVACNQPDYWEWRVPTVYQHFTCKCDSWTNICRIVDWSVARYYQFVQFGKDFLRPDT